VGQPLPARPLDGIDLTPVFDGKITERPTPLYFWEYNTSRFARAKLQPYIDPKLQEGTTPLAKLMGGKATRDFTNWRHPALTEADYLGARSIIEGRLKLVIHERKNGAPGRELFDLEADPAEKTNLAAEQPAIVDRLAVQLHAWQNSVLRSLTGADYAN
jgi:arylsulfatase A-like enzyme